MSLVKVVDWLKRQDNFAVPMKGVVVDNNDPKRLGRVKVTITDFLQDPDKTKLPWILPQNPAGFGGTPDGSSQTPPDIGAELLIEFPYKSIYFGFYTGYWQSLTTHQGLFVEDYPSSYGFRDTQASFIKVNRAKGYVTARHFGGAQIEATRDGGASLQAPGLMQFVSTDGKTILTLDCLNGTMSMQPRDSSELISPDHTVTADKLTIDAGNVVETITGSKVSTVLGAKSDMVAGSRSVGTVGNKSETVTGNTSNIFAQGVDESYGMSKTQTYVLGDKIAKLLLGNHEISIIVGDIIHKTLAGDAEFGNPLANLAFGIAGTAKFMSTLDTTIDSLLNIKLSALLNFQVDAQLMAQITAQVQAEVKAAIVLLGQGTAPVLTMETMPLVDNITGEPSIGVPTVLAG